jgi:uncharacterized protein YlxP (DUF503 family)
MVMRSLKDRMLNKMNVSFAEIAHQDVWKSARIAVVTVAAERAVVEKRLAAVSELIRSNHDAVLLDVMVEIL